MYKRKQLLPFISIKKSFRVPPMPSFRVLRNRYVGKYMYSSSKNLIAFIGILSNCQFCRGAERWGRRKMGVVG